MCTQHRWKGNGSGHGEPRFKAKEGARIKAALKEMIDG
jgi:hypothetical protein